MERTLRLHTRTAPSAGRFAPLIGTARRPVAHSMELTTPVDDFALVASGGRAGRQRVDRLGGQSLPADRPVAALDLVDDAPRHAAHVLALDADHRVREPFGDLRLLLGREDALDELDVDEGHVPLLRRGRPNPTTPPCDGTCDHTAAASSPCSDGLSIASPSSRAAPMSRSPSLARCSAARATSSRMSPRA